MKKTKEKIELPNRYGNKNYLKLIPGTTNKYELVFDDASCYYRIGKDNDGNLAFIDPEGGPMIDVGCSFGDKKLVKLEEDLENNRYVLTF